MHSKVKDFIAILFSRFGEIIVSLLVAPIVARVLTKEELGVYAFVAVINGFVMLFAVSGFNDYVIREQKFTDEKRGTVYFIAGAVGLVLMATMMLLSGWLASIFGLEEYITVFRISIVGITIGGIGGLPIAELRKVGEFGAIMRISLILAVLRFVGVAGVLLLNFGLLGYVIFYTSLPFIGLYLYSRKVDPIHFRFCRQEIRTIFNYIRGILAFNAINYWSRKMDDMLIGAKLGLSSLAIYTQSYALMMQPISHVSSLFEMVMFPDLAKKQNDDDALAKGVLRLIQVSASLAIPALLFFWLYRYEIIRIYLGPKWDEVAKMLTWLIPIAMLQLFVIPVGMIYKTRGKNDLLFKMGMLNTGVTIFAIYLGVLQGLFWVPVYYGAANVLLLYPSIRVAFGIVKCPFVRWLKVLAPFILYVGGVMLLSHALGKHVAFAVSMLLAAGVIVYLYRAGVIPKPWKRNAPPANPA